VLRHLLRTDFFIGEKDVALNHARVHFMRHQKPQRRWLVEQFSLSESLYRIRGGRGADDPQSGVLVPRTTRTS